MLQRALLTLPIYMHVAILKFILVNGHLDYKFVITILLILSAGSGDDTGKVLFGPS